MESQSEKLLENPCQTLVLPLEPYVEGYHFKVITDVLSPAHHSPSCSPTKHTAKGVYIPLPHRADLQTNGKDTNTVETVKHRGTIDSVQKLSITQVKGKRESKVHTYSKCEQGEQGFFVYVFLVRVFVCLCVGTN